MATLTISVMFAAGVFCLWWSWWPAPTRVADPPTPTLAQRIRRDLDQAELAWLAPIRLALFSGVLAMLAGVLVAAMTQAWAVGVVTVVLVGWLPIALVRARARSRREQLRALWPDVVDNIASAIRAGLSLPEALGAIGQRGPSQLRPPFTEFAENYRVSGRFQECLDLLKERLADPVADRLIESVRIARDVGGSDLGRLLRTLSSFLREEEHSRAEMRTRQSWTVNAARLAVAAPWLVLAMLATRPGALQAYARPTGALVLVFGAGCTAFAYRLMIRLARLPEEERVLQ